MSWRRPLAGAVDNSWRWPGAGSILSRGGLPFAPHLFNLFWLFIVELRELCISARVAAEQFVKFGVDGLGVTMLRSLDEKRHRPGGKRGHTMPVEGFSFEQEP